MPKTIDYPRTSYDSAWEVAEVVDDTGGKCAIEMAARKLDRKVSGSFKAIIGSAVKFGLLTSKREFLTTTNLFRRIKHAYDKREEKIYHREAFLHPPLFTQICRKFRNRELPVHMFDVMLIREFGVEEINAQGVAKAFVDGARAVDILDERNMVADIDQLAAQQGPRRELSAGEMPMNLFKVDPTVVPDTHSIHPLHTTSTTSANPTTPLAGSISDNPGFVPTTSFNSPKGDAISQLFGLDTADLEGSAFEADTLHSPIPSIDSAAGRVMNSVSSLEASVPPAQQPAAPAPVVLYTNEKSVGSVPDPMVAANSAAPSFRILISGPGIHTELSIEDSSDLLIVQSLLEKIKRQVRS